MTTILLILAAWLIAGLLVGSVVGKAIAYGQRDEEQR